ncbi:MAG: citrate/2-methylcitrate synthase, partial [Verrucomicrobiota bacterium]
SDITFINGEEGILRHRGYAIDELAENCLFLEAANLLIRGALPSQGDLDALLKEISGEYSLPEGMKELITGFPRDAHPMSVLSAMTSALSSYYPEIDDSEVSNQRATMILLGKLPTMAAYFYRHSIGEDLIDPDPALPYCANFLNMMFGDGSGDETRAVKIKALNRLLILHADHEQNCSTSTVRFIGSSGANLFASIAGGIGALWGPLHGGANQAVLEMLEKIDADGISMDTFIDKVKNDSDTRLMGFGHRVYKAYDPRATIAKASCGEVLDNLGVEDPLLDLAKQLETHALEDEYFVKRNLYPNVDYYTGITYRGMGIPAGMFTVLFAIGRLPGWIAHWV